MVDGARCRSPVRYADHSSTRPAAHCHGYSLVNAQNRRTSRSRSATVSSRIPRDFCCARQPRSIASSIASSGRS
jgi:hypothetical protein